MSTKKENFIKSIDTTDITLQERWKIAQLQRQNAEIKCLWFEIQDIIGPAKLWPHLVRKLFWTQSIKHNMRPIISAFVIINGLNPEVHILLLNCSYQ